MKTFALVGTTCTGKTHIAAALAVEFDAEVVCADSMTVYRGMDIGTAKPSAAERRAVPHHLVDIAAPGDAFTVASFQRSARAAFADIGSRDRRALVVGGSGLYFRAAVDDLKFPPTDAAVRARLQATDPGTLAVRLKELDPEAAAFIDLQNARRVVRALEVIELTGQPFSSFRAAWERYAPVVVAGLHVDGDVLDVGARVRLRAMLEAGFLQEVRALLEAGYRDALTASQAIGYPQAIALIEGAITEAEFIEETARATRRYARRQLSWFRRDPRVVWFDAADGERARDEVRAYYEQHANEE